MILCKFGKAAQPWVSLLQGRNRLNEGRKVRSCRERRKHFAASCYSQNWGNGWWMESKRVSICCCAIKPWCILSLIIWSIRCEIIKIVGWIQWNGDNWKCHSCVSVCGLCFHFVCSSCCFSPYLKCVLSFSSRPLSFFLLSLPPFLPLPPPLVRSTLIHPFNTLKLLRFDGKSELNKAQFNDKWMIYRHSSKYHWSKDCIFIEL